MEVVILAAGKGTRMKTEVPKVLIEVNGEPMLKRIMKALDGPKTPRKIIVVGENIEKIEQVLTGNITYAYQMVPLGTMDAYVQSLPYVSTKEVLVIPGDIPFLSKELVQDIIDYYYQNNIRNLIIGMRVLNPYGYGRITMDNRKIKLVEEKNCNDEQKLVNLINTGIYILHVEDVYPYFSLIKKDTYTNEYYLTDFINYLAKDNKLDSLIFPETFRLKGANDQKTLQNLINESQYENTFKKNY